MEIINRPIYLDHITSLLNRGMMLVLAYIPSITMFLPANFSALALMYWHMSEYPWPMSWRNDDTAFSERWTPRYFSLANEVS